MSALTLQRTSAAKAGWVIGLLFFAWLGFLFLPLGKKAEQPRAHATRLLEGEEELRVAGLRYNADWVGLPGYFKLWAPTLDWSRGKVTFGYWNPGWRRYSYEFEVVRTQDGYRFESMGQLPESNEKREGLDENGMLPTHPFDFELVVMATVGPLSAPPAARDVRLPRQPEGKPEVDISLKADPLTLPKPMLKIPPSDAKK